MWLCRHSSACSPGGVGGEVLAFVQGIEESGTHKIFKIAVVRCGG